MTNGDIKKYRKKNAFSYSLGSFPAFELLNSKPEMVEMILLHSDANDEIKFKLQNECLKKGIRILQNDRMIEKIREKECCLLIGVFKKYQSELMHDKNHVVLVNPGDAGNLGTIIRNCVGFGINDLAIVEPAVDLFHPKVIRASMGAK